MTELPYALDLCRIFGACQLSYSVIHREVEICLNVGAPRGMIPCSLKQILEEARICRPGIYKYAINVKHYSCEHDSQYASPIRQSLCP